jgi:hypothetical protein
MDRVPYRADRFGGLAESSLSDAVYGLVILMIHRDRPSIRLTADERRQFNELAARLRHELDGASFDPPERQRSGRRPGSAGRRGRAVRLVTTLAGTWFARPMILALGLLALGPVIVGWPVVASPVLLVAPATMIGLGGALTTLDVVRRGRRRAQRPSTDSDPTKGVPRRARYRHRR